MHDLDYIGSDVNAWIALAAALIIASNFTQLGAAASDIIMLKVVEGRGQTITFTVPKDRCTYYFKLI